MLKWFKRLSPLPPCISCDTSAPRSETASEPFLAGFEDRNEGKHQSTHRVPYGFPCGCIRCREYRAGWELADEHRFKKLKKLKKAIEEQ